MSRPDRRTFFVESYVPQLDRTAAAGLTSCLKATVEELRDEGLPLVWVRSFALVDEDTYVWIVEAADLEHVSAIEERAGLEFDHVVEVMLGEPPAG